jgi:branched-chain amino acid transport system ATP-binding protein
MRVEVEGLSKRFGGLQALNNVTFVAEAGQVTALIGPNGAGKTTLFNCVCGYCTPEEGDVRLDGVSIVGLRPYQVARRGLARTFQLVRPFHGLTVLETVLTAGHWRSGQGMLLSALGHPRIRRSERRLREEAMATLEVLGIADRAFALTQDLPYGLQRMVEIAKVLMTGAQTLLLDEPAAGLHDSEVDQLSAVVRGIAATGRTVLLVEHNVPFVLGTADHIVVLDFGSMIAAGTPAEISVNPVVIKSYLGTEGHHA